MPDWAEMPQFSFSTGAVTDQNSHSTTAGGRTGTPCFNTTGGWKAGTAPGGLMVQAPGLVVPMLWNRGSLFNGGFISNLPALSASGVDVSSSTGTQFWWDSPNSWGRQNFLIRRPRTMIVVVQTQSSDMTSVVAWMNTNYATKFAPVNVSVLVMFNRILTVKRRDQTSQYAFGIPLVQSPAVNTSVSGGVSPPFVSPWASISTNPAVYTGGDLYVAVLQNQILPLANPSNTIVNNYLFTAGGDVGYTTPGGWSSFAATGSGSTAVQFFLNSPKIAAEMTVIQQGAPKFKTYAVKLYQYNVNPTLNFLTAQTPNPAIPDAMANTIISGGSPYLTRNGSFTNGDLTSMLAQVLTDAVAFFPALP